jgi:hypothetical protein
MNPTVLWKFRALWWDKHLADLKNYTINLSIYAAFIITARMDSDFCQIITPIFGTPQCLWFPPVQIGQQSILCVFMI